MFAWEFLFHPLDNQKFKSKSSFEMINMVERSFIYVAQKTFHLPFRCKMIISRNFLPLSWTNMVIKRFLKEKLLRFVTSQSCKFMIKFSCLLIHIIATGCRFIVVMTTLLMDALLFSAEIDFHMSKNTRWRETLESLFVFFNIRCCQGVYACL